jgi:hypothetical protein
MESSTSLGTSSSLLGLGLGDHSQAVLGLLRHDTTTPVLADLLRALVEVGVDSLDKLGESSLVLLVDVGDGNSGGSLVVNDCSETSLALEFEEHKTSATQNA